MFASRNRYLIVFLIILNLLLLVGFVFIFVLFILNTNKTDSSINNLITYLESIKKVMPSTTPLNDITNLNSTILSNDIWESSVDNINVSIDFTNINELSYLSTKANQSCSEEKKSESLNINYANNITVTFAINPCGLGWGPSNEIASKTVKAKTGEEFIVTLMQSDFEDTNQNANYYFVFSNNKNIKDISITSSSNGNTLTLENANNLVNTISDLISNTSIKI